MEFRQTLIDEFRECVDDLSKVSQRNFIFISFSSRPAVPLKFLTGVALNGLRLKVLMKIRNAASRYDYQATAWMGLRKHYKNSNPAFIEIR